MAQGDDTPPPPGPPTGPALPIDDGIIVLLIVAIIYGVYKINRISKQVA